MIIPYSNAFIDGLKAIAGAAHVLTDPADIAPYNREWRGLYAGRAGIVVQPGSTPQVSDIVKLCASSNVPIVPQGGNTGLVGGQIGTDTRAIVLSLSRMNRIRDIDAPGFSMIAEAGATIHAVQEAAEKLAAAFWPGPLTLVLNYRGGDAVCDLARAGLDTLALRAPSHPVMQAVLQAFGRPLVAPSANTSGHVSATSAEHVAADLGAKIDLVLDSGAAQLGIESTIIGLTGAPPVLLRQGALTRERIEEALGEKIILGGHGAQKPSAPGQTAAHYATHTPLRLNASDVSPGEVLLAFGTPLGAAKIVRNLSATRDLTEAAANLFSHLRELDRMNASAIAVMPIPNSGLGEAINDRLRRATLGMKR